MARFTLPKLFRSMAFNAKHLRRRTRAFPLFLESIEERIVPATLPQPTVLTPTDSTASFALQRQDPTALNQNTTIDYLNPQAVSDPTNALNQVLVATSITTVGGVSTYGVVGEKTTNGGQTWTTISNVGKTTRDPSLALGTLPTDDFTNASYPSVAFGRNGEIYFVYLETNATKSYSAVVYEKATSIASNSSVPKVVYQWDGAGDPALNPVIAVDNNVGSFTDSGGTFTDTMVNSTTGLSKGIYIAWNGNATTPAIDISPATKYNANPIMTVVSANDGTTFSNPIPVSDGGYLSGNTVKFPTNSAAPQIVFAPGTSGMPGGLVFVWPQLDGTVVYDATQPDGGVAGAPAASIHNVTAASTNSIRASTSGDANISSVPDVIGPYAGQPGEPVTPWTYGTNSTIADAAQRVQGTALALNGLANVDLVAGTVTGVTVSYDGYGYNNVAQNTAGVVITFSGGGGTGATGFGVVNSATGRLTGAVTITNPGSGYTSQPTAVFAAPLDSTGGTTDVANTTVFPLTISAASGLATDANFTLADLSVAMTIATPHLEHMQITLVAPNGKKLILLNNNVDGNGTAAAGRGVASSPGGLGISNGNFDTTFTSDAARRINDTGNTAPFIGDYRPEDGGLLPGETIAQYFGLTGRSGASFANTKWYIEVTDFRNDRTGANVNVVQTLNDWSLKFTSIADFATDQDAGPVGIPVGADPTLGSSYKPVISPTTGLPGTISAAFDTSLGSGSPFAGSLYIAYTSPVFNTAGTVIIESNINVARFTIDDTGTLNEELDNQVNDDSASDNFTEGNRSQFIPAVTVDPFTGTAVTTWYDARLDANNTRASTFIATSIDGGDSWSNQTFNTDQGLVPFLNQPKDALDVITDKTYTLGPVPTNWIMGAPIANATTNAIAVRQTVIASGGNLYAYWAGNSNAVGSNIMSAHAVTAAGPRVVGADMGPVVAASSIGGITYNNTFDSTGVRGLDGFTVTFDRMMNSATVVPAAFIIQYRNPYDPIGVTPTTIAATNVVDIDGLTFLVRFPAQYRPGTYSYAVLPTVADTLANGNLLDQNANAVAGESDVDEFSIPTSTTGTPFVAPYLSTTLPLIIPGQQLIASSLPNGDPSNSSLALAGVASAVDVTFSYDVNNIPANGPVFGPSNIVRITGPNGVIYDRATALTDPLTVTRLSARQYRIGFPAQVLSGSYTVEIDPQFAAATDAATTLGGGSRYVLGDADLNAGLDLLRGTALSPSDGVASNSTYNGSFTGAAATIPAATTGSSGTVPSSVEFPITVADSYLIALSAGHQITVQLNISDSTADNTSVVDLIGELVAPDGTTIRLFTNAGNSARTPGTLWFSNTLFSDAANTPIQTGFQPFDSGPYNPQFPLGNLQGMNVNGTWMLRIINTGSHTPKLTSWSLSLPQISGGTGLGEAVADRFSVSFRVFNQDPTSRLTQDVWTPVGPAPENGPGGNTARTNAFAIDPSDPTGNTAYLGAASGGLWKTTDFLTTDPNGPTYMPLGDSAPTYGLNVVSIAVFGRNNDPQQSIIFALTGEGDTTSPGVGVLRSMDGGKTWVVLDSTNNADTPTVGGNITPIDSPASVRDRKFFGVTGYKIIVDPVAVNDADKDVIVYMATGSGVWRSSDTGRHWTLMQAGTATDIVLAQGSAATVGNKNLQILYAAFQGVGVFIAQPAYAAAAMIQLSGSNPGNGTFIDGDKTLQNRVPIALPVDTPNGSKGRILLATPALTNNPIQDLNYQGWLYALVVTKANSLDGLYMTKDFGQNWTKIDMSQYLVPANPATGTTASGYGTNDYTQTDHDPFSAPPGTSNPLPGQGNYDVGFAIDPLNPNVVYIGGTNDAAVKMDGSVPGDLVRVDTTGVQDAHAIIAYDNSSIPPGNIIQFTDNSGNITTKAAGTKSQTTGANLGPGLDYGVNSLSGQNLGYLNVLRNPDDPFNANTLLFFTNVTQINNKGWGATVAPFFPSEVSTDIHRITTMVDPITGKTRVIVEDDQGIGSAVDDGTGHVITSLGSNPGHVDLPGLNRNGNLQIIQLYSSAVQPGQLAAEIAGAMFYGEAQDDGFPVASDSILQTGGGNLLTWSGSTGDGSWGLTDQTGSGTYYDYKWPCCGGNNSNFFQVDGTTRTFGLLLPTDNPAIGQGQWPKLGGSKFAVNPIDANGLLMSAIGDGNSNTVGRLWRSTDQGRTWFEVAGQDAGYTNLGGYAQALAFGSPNTSNPNQFNNFMYAGAGGKLFVTFTGGSPWKDITGSLSGTIQQISPDPVRGSTDVYVVTDTGVYYTADSSVAAPTWVNITGIGAGNIFALTKPIFDNGFPNAISDTVMMRSLTTIAPDWRYAIPVDPNDPTKGSFPVLYVGGYGGVVRSVDQGKTWEVYPVGSTVDPATGPNPDAVNPYSYSYVDPTSGTTINGSITTPDGGYFPSVDITQLTLSQGNIDPNTGLPLQQTGGLNMLTAATYGRGDWVIRLGTPDNDPVIASITKYQVVKQSGPKVIGVTSTSSANSILVQFDSPVLKTTFNTNDIQLTDAGGHALTITSVQPVVDTVGPATEPAIPGTPADFHDKFLVTFSGLVTGGYADITIGPRAATSTTPADPGPSDYAGFGMNQNDNFLNGETTADPNNFGHPADAYHGFVILKVATVGTTTADFSDGAGGLSLDGFSATGLWHATSTATGATLPGHSGPEFAYFGLDATGNYDTGVPNFGDLTSGSITLASGSPTLTFNYRLDTEYPEAGFPPDYDFAEVQISNDSGGSWTTIAGNTAGGGGTPGIVDLPEDTGWSPVSIDLSAYASQTVLIRFEFTSDGLDETYLGWQVDDFSVPSVVVPQPGNLFINQPVVTTAGDPTKVIISAIDPNTGLPMTNFTGKIDLNATINGQAVVLTDMPVVNLASLVDTAGTVTVTASGTSTFPYLAGQSVVIGGTTNYNGTFPIFNVTATSFQFLIGNPALATENTGNVTGPLEPVAAQTGTPALTPSLPLPTTYQFTSADAGEHVFTIFYIAASGPITSNPQTLLTVHDESGLLNDAKAFITVNAAHATQFIVSPMSPNPMVAGFTPGAAFTVTAEDQYGNIDQNYTGQLTLTSSTDSYTYNGGTYGGAVFSADAPVPASPPPPPPGSPYTYTFTAGDSGVHHFHVILDEAGLDTITATDATNSAQTIKGTQNILVVPAAPEKVTVAGFTSPTIAGVSHNFTVSLKDHYDNVATNYTGTITINGSDPFPGVYNGTVGSNTYTFTGADAGSHTFPGILKTAGTQSITATLPTSFSGSQTGIIVNNAAINKLAVSGFPSSTTAGVAHNVTVTAEDPFGNPITTGVLYTGTVKFTTTDPYLPSSLPANYKFTAADGKTGSHTFANGATLFTAGAGTQSITATDTVTGSITGAESGITVVAAAAKSVTVDTFPSTVIAGVPNDFNVTLKDLYGNIATGYTGKMVFSTSNPQFTFLPVNYTFTSSDMGHHLFSGGATLKTAGTGYTITAKDTVNSLTGTETGITVTPAASEQILVDVFPTSTVAGATHDIRLTIEDLYGNVTPNYVGTVNLSSGDPYPATFSPSSYTFSAGDNGTHTITSDATLFTAGTQTITASDGAIQGTENVTVVAALANHLAVSGFPTADVAGVAHNFTVAAEDQYGNVDKTYTGKVHFSSSTDLNPFPATLPSDYTFTIGSGKDNGSHTFANGATLFTAGSQSLSATDGTISGMEGGIVVTAAPASQFALNFPTTTKAGTTQSFSIVAQDAWQNTDLTYSGTANLTLGISDPAATFVQNPPAAPPAPPPLAVKFDGTTGSVAVDGTLIKQTTPALLQSITATDSVTSSIKGTESGITVLPGVKSFSVTGFPTTTTAGDPHNFTITVKDNVGNIQTDYTGTVTISSTDGNAVFPIASYHFTLADAGTHTFIGTLKTASTQQIIATDTINSLSGSESVTVTAASASSLTVTSFPSPVVAGDTHTFTVTAKDPYGNVANSTSHPYLGTVTFSSTDGQAVFPVPSYTFNSGDPGVHSFTAMLETHGSQSITATDSNPAVVAGTQSGIIVTNAAMDHFVVVYATTTVAGVANNLTVEAVDSYGNPIVGTSPTPYTGTVSFSSTDGIPFPATLPAPYTFLASENGVHTFTVIGGIGGATLYTAGPQTISAADGTFTTPVPAAVTVTPAAASSFTVDSFPTSVMAGDAHSFTVTAKDPYNNVATGYKGTVTFSSSDAQAALPVNYTFVSGDNGSHTFNVISGIGGATLKTVNVASPNSVLSPGTQSITATDNADGAITGSETGITVTPAATSKYIIEYPTPTVAGVVQSYVVRASDQYGNTTPTYSANVTISTLDPSSFITAFPQTGSLVSGSHTFTGALYTAGNQLLKATDGTFSGSETVLVKAAAAATMSVAGFPTTSDVAGVSHNFTVTLIDSFGNVAAGYTGTIALTSTDPHPATFTNPAGTLTASPPYAYTYTFTGSGVGKDNGVHTFGGTLFTAGTQSITAADINNVALTNTETPIAVTAAQASTFIVAGVPGTVQAGSSHDITVTAKDPFNNTDMSYSKTVTFSSTDVQAGLPANYTFTTGVGADNGTHTFSLGATLKTVNVTSPFTALAPGTQSITVKDTTTGSITGTESGITVTAAATSKFLIAYPATTAGVSQNFTVTASDPYGNTTTGYTGSFTIGTTDPSHQAAFPQGTQSITAGQNGVASFSGTLITAPSQTINVNDSVHAFTGSQTVAVTANVATTVDVSGYPTTVTAGVPNSVTVTMRDTYGNKATGYVGTVTLTSSDPFPASFAPASYAFTAGDQGFHTFSVTLKTAGMQSITATAKDPSNNTLAGSQTGIQVNAAAASQIVVSGFPSPDESEVPHTFTATMKDPFGNVAVGYLGTVTITSSDPLEKTATTPLASFIANPTYQFTAADAGVHQFTGILRTFVPSLQSITVTDIGSPGVTGTQSNIQMTSPSVASFTLTGQPALANGGTSFPLLISAFDQLGLPLPTYNGTVTFSSSDPYATLPASITLVNGLATANFTLFTPSNRSISVKDTLIPTATGSVNVNIHGGVQQPAVVSNEYAAGAGTGQQASLFKADGTLIETISPFSGGNGVRTAVADFNLDGTPDFAVGTGPGILTEVKVYDGKTGGLLFDVQPFQDFDGGVFITSGDIKGDGYPDLIITPDEGGGPRVLIFHGGDFSKMADFYGIQDPNFRGGARAAAGDINGDDHDEVVVSAGFSGGPRISVYDGAALSNGGFVHPVNDFFAFGEGLRDGAYVAVGDVNGDGRDDLIFGAGPGGGPQIIVVDSQSLLNTGALNAVANPIVSYFTGLPATRGGVRVTAKNLDGDKFTDIVAGDGDLAGSSVRIYYGNVLEHGGIATGYSFDAYPELNAGVFVG